MSNYNDNNTESSPALDEELTKFLQDVVANRRNFQFTLPYKISQKLTEKVRPFYFIECNENSTTFTLKSVLRGIRDGTIRINDHN
jgi:hypothetical protein